MTHLKRLIFMIAISLILTPLSYADMGPEIATKVKKKYAAKPCATPHRHHHHHKHHHPDLCSYNCCEIKVDDQEIDRSYCLQVSGALPVDALYYEYYRQQALEFAIADREEAARLCKACPETAKAFISCARLIEYSWRHVDAVDFVPCDPCGEDKFLSQCHEHHPYHYRYNG